MPRLVTKFKYLKPGTGGRSVGGYARYIATREGAERIDDSHRHAPATQKQQALIEKNDISTLPVDSIYTPVLKCNYTVENTRVGQITDYDKLTLEVWTNGVINAQEAVSLAAKVLTEQDRKSTRLNSSHT